MISTRLDIREGILVGEDGASWEDGSGEWMAKDGLDYGGYDKRTLS